VTLVNCNVDYLLKFISKISVSYTLRDFMFRYEVGPVVMWSKEHNELHEIYHGGNIDTKEHFIT
jgi:hypothetical protein